MSLGRARSGRGERARNDLSTAFARAELSRRLASTWAASRRFLSIPRTEAPAKTVRGSCHPSVELMCRVTDRLSAIDEIDKRTADPIEHVTRFTLRATK